MNLRSILSVINIAVLLSGSILSGCKKDSDPPDPYIVYDQPYQNQVFHVFDTMQVKAHIISEDALIHLQVSLTDAFFTPVLPVYVISTMSHDQQTWVVNQSIPIDAFQLPGGTYYVWIKATTAHVSKNKYLEIRIIESEKKFEKIILVLRSQPQASALWEVDSQMQVHYIQDVPVDYGYSSLVSSNRTLYLAGRNVAILLAWHVDSARVMWQKQGQGTADLPFFQGLTWENKLLFTASSDGRLNGYDSRGDLKFYRDFGFSEYPVRNALFGSRIIVSVERKSGSARYLNNYHYPSGAYQIGVQTPFTTLAVYALDGEKCLIAGNSNGKGALYHYFPDIPTLDGPLRILTEKLEGILKIDMDHFLLYTGSTVYVYQASTRNLSTFISNTRLLGADMDVSGSRIITGNATMLSVYSFPSGQLLHAIPLPDTLRACHVLYNK